MIPRLTGLLKHPSAICALAVWSAWLILTRDMDLRALYVENWPMALTMVFGSFIAGSTSEGGGAVAFPVMTLVFGTEPTVARDFSLMIQSVGMTAASLTILAMRIPIAPVAIALATLGGGAGMVFGLEHIAPAMSPPYAKVFFTSCWLSFAVALVLINRDRQRSLRMTRKLKLDGAGSVLLLLVTGFFGGVVSSITGSGLDILTFSVLVLYFHLDEGVATPTSVVMMAINAMIGFAWKGQFSDIPLRAEAWTFWYACIPVVVVGAPLGAIFIARRSRSVVVGILFASIAVQYLGALVLIRQTPELIAFNLAVFGAGSLVFRLLARAGSRRTVVPGGSGAADPMADDARRKPEVLAASTP